ncbi:MAG: ankyrin repeat domain-containing protein [Verrucomicrobiota bacterium]
MSSELPPGPAFEWLEQPIDFVLLGSSKDVQHIRQEAFRLTDKIIAELALSHEVRPFEWERDISKNGWDARRSMQLNLPRPASSKCRAVFTVIGERIGFPLEDSFPAASIADYSKLIDPTRRFRLQHPWPEKQDEALKLVADGYYPLTGTVFEYLDATGAGRPALLCYLANKPIRPGEGRVILNQNQWEKQMAFNSEDERDQWRQGEYKIQTWGVHNFINSLAEQSRFVQHCLVAEDCVKYFQLFLHRADLLGDEVLKVNPYRALDYFDIEDARDFAGYAADVKHWISLFRYRVDMGKAPLIMKIVGASGCGKSSFLRAGILAALIRPEELQRFRVVAVRPTEFYTASGKPEGLMTRLLTIVAERIEALEFSGSEMSSVQAAGAKAVQLTLEILSTRLDQLASKTPVCLVVGLDQFEEIVDDLAGGIHRDAWLQLIEFIGRAALTKNIGFIYTLEASRTTKFAQLDLPAAFADSIEVPLDGSSDRFLWSVIKDPFYLSGYKLSDQIIRTLITNYHSAIPTTAGASNLPLLSLKLYELFDRIDEVYRLPRFVRHAGSTPFGRLRIDEAARREIALVEVEDDLRFDNLLEDLAEAAWVRKSDDETKEVEELDFFLQPLVRLGGERGTDIRLTSLGPLRYYGARERMERFKRYRLVVREPDGSHRLVHEAVIRLWPLAVRWQQTRSAYLLQEAKLRSAAAQWDELGRTPAALPSGDEFLWGAGDVLAAHMHAWSFAADAELQAEDRLLKAYCIALFGRHCDPIAESPSGSQHKGVPVLLAASYGLVELLRRFIRDHPECVNYRSARGRTPLGQAAWSQPKAVRVLLEAGASPTAAIADGWPPITAAIIERDREIFDALIGSYSDPATHQCPHRRTLLHMCAQYGAKDMANAFMALGADPAQTDEEGWDALFHASRSGDLDVFDAFRPRCSLRRTDLRGDTLLHVAAAAGRVNVIERLCRDSEFEQMLTARNNQGLDALMVASSSRQPEAAAALLKRIRPDAEASEGSMAGWTALHCALNRPTAKGRLRADERISAVRTVRVLLQHPNTDPNHRARDGKRPFQRAAHLPEIRRLLLDDDRFDYGALLGGGGTCLIDASRDGNAGVVARILENPHVDVDFVATDNSYAPALMLRSGLVQLLEALIQEGRCQPWAAQQFKRGLLSVAIETNAKSICNLLLASIPNPVTPLIGAWFAEAIRSILTLGRERELFDQLLVPELPIDVDIDSSGRTLLHLAACHGDFPAFVALLNKGPRRILDAWGRSPADVAPIHTRRQFHDRLVAYRLALKLPELPPNRPSLGTPNPERAKSRRSPLHDAALHGHLGRLDELLHDPAIDPESVDAWNRRAFHFAPERTRQEITEMLRAATKSRPPRRSAAHTSAKRGLLQWLQLLTRQRLADLRSVDAWDRTPVDVAPDSVRAEVRRILASGSRLTSAERRVWRRAVRQGDLDQLSQLLRKSPLDPTTVDAWGRSWHDLGPECRRADISRIIQNRSLVATMNETPLSPLDTPNWTSVASDSAEFSLIAASQSSPSLSSATTRLTVLALDFYRAYRLYQAEDSNWANLRLFFLSDGVDVYRLDGSSSPIHQINAKAQLILSEQNVLRYLSFFCLFVHGDRGPFLVIDSLTDSLIPAALRGANELGPSEPAKKLFQLYRRPALFGTDPDGKFRTSAMVLYANAVFLADFLVQPDGMITMVDDEPLIADVLTQCEFRIK